MSKKVCTVFLKPNLWILKLKLCGEKFILKIKTPKATNCLEYFKSIAFLSYSFKGMHASFKLMENSAVKNPEHGDCVTEQKLVISFVMLSIICTPLLSVIWLSI